MCVVVLSVGLLLLLGKCSALARSTLSALGIWKEAEHCMMSVCNDSKNGEMLLLLSNVNEGTQVLQS